MSIEAMYPSRSQSRSQNPLFARAFRRRKLCLMLILASIGIGLLVLQLFPMTAHADVTAQAAAEVPAPLKAPAAVAVEPIKTNAASGKPVRMIQIYDVPAH
jgi:hypothetical protein